jgi:F-type H+-transporting ATPase subunit b
MADPATSAAGAGGLPQFDLAQWPGEIAWALAVFLVLYLLFAFVFVPRVSGAIEKREDKISGDFGDARRLRDEAQAQADAAAREMDEARARAHRVAGEARAAAKAQSDARQAEEDTKLDALLADAERRIGVARGEAMGHVRAIAAQAAEAMVERLTGAAPTGPELDRALGEAQA